MPYKTNQTSPFNLITRYGELFGKLLDEVGNVEESKQLMLRGFCGSYESIMGFVETLEAYSPERLSKLSSFALGFIDWGEVIQSVTSSLGLVVIAHDNKVHVFSKTQAKSVNMFA